MFAKPRDVSFKLAKVLLNDTELADLQDIDGTAEILESDNEDNLPLLDGLDSTGEDDVVEILTVKNTSKKAISFDFGDDSPVNSPTVTENYDIFDTVKSPSVDNSTKAEDSKNSKVSTSDERNLKSAMTQKTKAKVSFLEAESCSRNVTFHDVETQKVGDSAMDESSFHTMSTQKKSQKVSFSTPKIDKNDNFSFSEIPTQKVSSFNGSVEKSMSIQVL